jgi:fumarate reductase subunit C
LAGVVALARGRTAYDAWWTVATHPLAILLNLILLVFAVYHTWTWFSVLPKTTPDIDVEPKLLIAAGIGAAVVLCAALFAFAWWGTR